MKSFFPLSSFPFVLVTLLAACTAFPFDRLRTPPLASGQPGDGSQPTAAAVLPQPTDKPASQPSTIDNTQYAVRNPVLSGAEGTQSQIVDVRIPHVQDLTEVLVEAGDPVEAGQALAQLDGYAEELNREVQLVELELAQAEAKLAAARQDAVAAHEQQVTDVAARVTRLERRIADLQRQQQIAVARLAEARATTAHRQRWLDILAPLEEFDPWGDLPYLVGSQDGPQGRRSDLAYREAVAKAEYDLRLAELAQQIAEQQAADVAAQLQQAQADLAAAQATLERLRAAPPSAIQQSSHLAIYQDSVRINELRLAQAQAEVEKTVVKSLVSGQVLDVRVDRVDGNEATVIIRITTR